MDANSILLAVFVCCLFATARAGNRDDAFFGYHELGDRCSDKHTECKLWASKRECVANPYFMRQNCRKACAACGVRKVAKWPGFATEAGTRQYAAMLPTVSQHAAQGHFRKDTSMGTYDTPGQRVRGAPWLTLSSLGTGTYLGEPTDEVDEDVIPAIISAVMRGMNVIDTASNYRSGRAEQAVGKALQALRAVSGVKREMLFISTKAGFIESKSMQQLLQKGSIKQTDVRDGAHCIHPACLEASLQRSLKAMGLDTVDVLYLHNVAEMLPGTLESLAFEQQLMRAFEWLEQARGKKGLIRAYGMATWTCFRQPPGSPGFLSLQRIVELAKKVGGRDHGFRYIQLPVNAGMLEAVHEAWQPLVSQEGTRHVTLLQAAGELGVGAIASGPLGEGSLLSDTGLQDKLQKIGALRDLTPSSRLLQIVRSTQPHLLVAAVVGQKSINNVRQNLELVARRTLDKQEFEQVLSVLQV